MVASIGVWAQGDTTGAQVLYRWEAEQQQGYVLFEPAPRAFRPADDTGTPIGDLRIDASADETTGTADGVNRALLGEAVVAILRGYSKAGAPPATAHAYYS
ncbi:hypothetical protein [Actinoplanes sp. RD1]|uniref:hypothetical protein n=1 Tax=Actinoplanes sp. RD1 TaxID=3064538 RepID=UPI002740C027|nr:hypothetical protein [Actinoplanes sp. RD1]